jgi:hypothetical protein
MVFLVDDDNDDLEFLKEVFANQQFTFDIKCFNASSKVVPLLNDVN